MLVRKLLKFKLLIAIAVHAPVNRSGVRGAGQASFILVLAQHCRRSLERRRLLNVDWGHCKFACMRA